MIPKQTNLPKKDDKNKLVYSYLCSPKAKEAIHIAINVIVKKLIIPVTLCDIETSEDICQL